MIGEAELRRWAARWSVDPMVVDLDYTSWPGALPSKTTGSGVSVTWSGMRAP